MKSFAGSALSCYHCHLTDPEYCGEGSHLPYEDCREPTVFDIEKGYTKVVCAKIRKYSNLLKLSKMLLLTSNAFHSQSKPTPSTLATFGIECARLPVNMTTFAIAQCTECQLMIARRAKLTTATTPATWRSRSGQSS